MSTQNTLPPHRFSETCSDCHHFLQISESTPEIKMYRYTEHLLFCGRRCCDYATSFLKRLCEGPQFEAILTEYIYEPKIKGQEYPITLSEVKQTPIYVLAWYDVNRSLKPVLIRRKNTNILEITKQCLITPKNPQSI